MEKENFFKALQKAKIKKSSRQQEDKKTSKNLLPQNDLKTSVTAKENISTDIAHHQTPYDTHESPSHVQNNQDTKPHQLSPIIEKNRKMLKESFVGKNECVEELLMLRRENSKHLFKKAKTKKKIFKKKRKENLFTLYKPNSIVSESFKIIRTRLLNMIKEKGIKTILVTSALPEEGKSFVASNLAVSIASGLDQHVLLVGADTKKPSLDEIFNIDSELGLSDYLVNEKHNLSDLIHKTKVPKLSYLSSGSSYERSSELLASEVMKMFVLEMKCRYDDRYIIFDAPPAQMSETLGLADKVDGIILVVRAGKTDKKLIRETAKITGMKKNLGVVLNQFNLKALPYYKYYK